MKDRTKKILAGTGALAAGAAAAAAAVRGLSRYMVGVAMDREGPKQLEKQMEAVSGSGPSPAEDAAGEAAGLLEEQTHTLIRLQSHDGLELVGHWYPAREPKRILIAMHGWRSSWSRDFGVIAPFWQENGCSILFAEQRGQGQSDGEYIGFGMLERHDCLCWAAWAQEQDAHNLPVYLVGLSMGASTVLMASELALPERVRGIMADCGFTSAHEIWKHVAEDNLHLRYALFAPSVERLCRQRIDMGARECSTVDALKKCKVPVLLVHGTADTFVPVSMTYENYSACAAPKRLLVVPGAEHAMSYIVDRPLYEKTVLEFWEEFDGGAEN